MHNYELKLWSCSDWRCLQTINLTPTVGKGKGLKAAIDLTRQYLVLSDISRKMVYVLHIREVRF